MDPAAAAELDPNYTHLLALILPAMAVPRFQTSIFLMQSFVIIRLIPNKRKPEPEKQKLEFR